VVRCPPLRCRRASCRAVRDTPVRNTLKRGHRTTARIIESISPVRLAWFGVHPSGCPCRASCRAVRDTPVRNTLKRGHRTAARIIESISPVRLALFGVHPLGCPSRARCRAVVSLPLKIYMLTMRLITTDAEFDAIEKNHKCRERCRRKWPTRCASLSSRDTSHAGHEAETRTICSR
jgi:bacterioferritin-associated ferredoxin